MLAALDDPDPAVKKAAESAAKAMRLSKQKDCLLYTSDAADERSSVDLGGRRIIKKKKQTDRGLHI